MIKVRKSEDRGHADFGWLKAKHSFSFGRYYDPQHMGFGPLRVINQDRVAPGRGFDPHPHDNMEIITYILDGALAHKDSMGHGSTIRPGDVQRMSAGTGVVHSEYNASHDEEVQLLQIWIKPDARNVTPGYAEKHFPTEERQDQLRLVVSKDGREGSLSIHQDADLFASVLNGSLRHELAPGRVAWLQLARGDLTVNGESLKAGDGAAISDVATLDIAGEDAEFLLFDMVA